MLEKRLLVYEQRHFDAVTNHQVAVAAGNAEVAEESEQTAEELTASIRVVRRLLKHH